MNKLIFCLLLFLPSLGKAAIANVNFEIGAGCGGCLNTTVTKTMTAGSSVHVFVACQNSAGGTVLGLTDDKGDSFTGHGLQTVGVLTSEWFSAVNIVGGSTVFTATDNNNCNALQVGLVQNSGEISTSVASAIDNNVFSDTATGTAMTTASFTPTVGNEAILIGCSTSKIDDAAGIYTSSWGTQLVSQYNIGIAQKIVTGTPASQSPAMTANMSATWACNTVSFKAPTTVTGLGPTIKGSLNQFFYGFPNLVVGSNISSGSTIAPVQNITHITGTTTINTITVPAQFAQTNQGGCITLIPDGVWATGTSGNIALATTAVVGKALTECYDSVAAKWYPSY